MPKPIIVYLDSSDWSNIAAALSPEPFAAREKWRDVRRRLLASRDAGVTEFRFSEVIVAETYPISAAHHASGVARAHAIAELCGSLCLLETNTLTRREVRMLASDKRPPFDRALALRDDGAWHSNPDDFSSELGAELLTDGRTMVRESLKDDFPHLKKRQRRAAEDMLVDSNGRLAPSVRERLLDPAVTLEVAALAAAKLGLPHDTPGLDILARVMACELPPSAADAWLIGLLRDLPTLFSLIPTREKAEQIFGYLRAAGKGVSVPITEAASHMEKFIADYGLQVARRLHAERPFLGAGCWRADLRARILSCLWEDERKQRGQERRIRGEAWFEHVNGSLFGSIPTLDTFLAAGAALVAKGTTVSRQPYRGRASDLGDVAHMSYLPYVDIFRCDGGNAQLANAAVAELNLSSRIAPTIEELLRLIERK